MTKKSELETQLINDIASFHSDPHGFVMYAFPWGTGELRNKEPDQWQVNAMNDIRDGLKTPDEVIQEAIASGHGIGKSAFVSWIILWALCTFEDAKGIVTANTENQLRTKTIPEVSKWFRLLICKHWFKITATAIFAIDSEHERTWRVDFIPWSESNPEAFAGMHNEGSRIFIIFDEASKIADNIWETIEGALTDKDTEIIWIVCGNPTRNSGRFRQCFGRFRHRWVTRKIDSRTVKITNKVKIKEWEEDYGVDSDFFRVRVRGLFPKAGSMQLIPSDRITEAMNRELPDSVPGDRYVLGVDVARFGSDSSVIVPRKGRDARSRKWKRFKKRDTVFLASEVAKEARECKAIAIFVDGTGIGAGVVDQLRNLELPEDCTVYDIQFSGSPDGGWGKDFMPKTKVKNKRAEMWCVGGNWLSFGCIPDETRIQDDLEGPEYYYNLKDELLVEKKEDMRKRGLPSPDDGDGLMLTFAYPANSGHNPLSSALETLLAMNSR